MAKNINIVDEIEERVKEYLKTTVKQEEIKIKQSIFIQIKKELQDLEKYIDQNEQRLQKSAKYTEERGFVFLDQAVVLQKNTLEIQAKYYKK